MAAKEDDDDDDDDEDEDENEETCESLGTGPELDTTKRFSDN